MRVFDSHFHIIDPQFPLVANQGFLPAPFLCSDYLRQAGALGLEVTGGAVVSGSFQAFDQGYLLAALQQLGTGFVGVTQLPADTVDARILELDRAGVRAVRFNLHRGGSEHVSQLDRLARRVHELAGWHVELYVDSTQLAELTLLLLNLPALSIDHLGLSADGQGALLRLVENGARVKATGFSRCTLQVAKTLRRIHDANPDALMFGSDLPCTRAPRAFGAEDLQLLRDTFEEKELEKLLHDNASHFYRSGA